MASALEPMNLSKNKRFSLPCQSRARAWPGKTKLFVLLGFQIEEESITSLLSLIPPTCHNPENGETFRISMWRLIVERLMNTVTFYF